MGDLGFNEVLIIFFVAVLIIAPNDLPKIMKSLGKFLARLRLFSRKFNSYIHDFIDNSLLDKEDKEEK